MRETRARPFNLRPPPSRNIYTGSTGLSSWLELHDGSWVWRGKENKRFLHGEKGDID
jgi:hypothetical protein